jgi:hypothetical protein
VGFACRAAGSSLDRVYADVVKRTEKEEPFLLNTDFITLSSSKYDIRSKDYSIVHCLRFEEFKSILSGFSKDYEYYCFLKDRAKSVLNEHETIPCTDCRQKHTRFACPKLHFIPIREHVVHKELHARQVAKNQRKLRSARGRRTQNALLLDRICEKERGRLAELRGDSFEDLPQIMTLMEWRTEGILS